ncbi:Alpha-D-kanosaminyltransferase [bioreactor metagenome]|uniref:Alpha-D-kanosaminyltransferase n=1 Tax=bioreactor metagenome TaxID=1076179 RepID=A0A645CPP6_9ZZZZ
MKKTGSMKPDFHLIVVGDGDMYPYIQQLVQKLDLGAEVELIKKASHDEVLRMISTVKAIVLLSRYEGQSMFITESLSLGKPLILSDNNGMSDMIVNGENGYSVKTGDHVAGARAIIEIQNMDAEKIALMGKKSRDLYETNYSCEAVYKQFDSIMQFKD